MKRSFEGLSPKMHPQKLRVWLKLSSKGKGYNCPVIDCKNCRRAFPKVAHKLGFGRGCPCNILPTSYVTKVVRQAIAYLEGIK